MYQDVKYFPFYTSGAGLSLWGGERAQEEEFLLMKSYYPETALKIQELVEEECQFLDYEGSRIYDEYPDRFMFRQMCSHIRKKAELLLKDRELPEGFLDELVQVLFCQEISRRRCRRHRGRSYF